MKHILFILALSISGSIFAQKTIERSVGDFTDLKVYDLIKLELVKSDENKIVITGEHTEDVLVNNKNGLLKVKMNLKKTFNGKKTKITLYFTSVDVIDVNEGAQISSEDVIKQFEIDLKAQEGGTIDIGVDVTYTNIKSVSGGVITTTGISRNQKVDINTGGVYKGEKLVTEETEVAIKVAGEVYVNATDEVDVKIRAGGNVYIYGNTTTVIENIGLGGKVHRMD